MDHTSLNNMGQGYSSLVRMEICILPVARSAALQSVFYPWLVTLPFYYGNTVHSNGKLEKSLI